VIEARSKATGITIDPANLNEANLQQFQQAQEGLGSALSRLMVVVERYPDLKANQNFMDLQQQLEKTENRITVERRNFNLAAQDYNTQVRHFPNNLFAGLFGFEKKVYFQGASGVEKAPDLKDAFKSE
jgi:LemA protein